MVSVTLGERGTCSCLEKFCSFFFSIDPGHLPEGDSPLSLALVEVWTVSEHEPVFKLDKIHKSHSVISAQSIQFLEGLAKQGEHQFLI